MALYSTIAKINLIREFGVADPPEPRKLREFRDHHDAFTCLTDRKFVQLFRLDKDTVREVCEALRPHLPVRSKARTAMTVEQKVLTALRYYAYGSNLDCLSCNDKLANDKSTVSRCITAVSDAIFKSSLVGQYYGFPNSVGEKLTNKTKFYQLAEMPGCVGAIDGTYIAIRQPNEERFPGNYWCHKAYYALNTMVVADADMRIINIDARHPGSCHDAAVWHVSSLRALIENGALSANEWLLGDSGYPLQPWLMTPIAGTPEADSAEGRYNWAHTHTRVVVERTIGLLKSRFRCLQRYRTMLSDPERANKIFLACAVLHNMCRAQSIELVLSRREKRDDNKYRQLEAAEERRLKAAAARNAAHPNEPAPSCTAIALRNRGKAQRNEVLRQYF